MVEAKAVGTTLSGVEPQTLEYCAGLPPDLSPLAWHDPLPFRYTSTGVETFYANDLDPEPRSRRLFSFHRPETLADWLKEPDTLRSRLRQMPPLITQGLRQCQIEGVTNLEHSFAQDRPRTAGLGALTAGGLGVAGLTETGRNLAGKAGRWAGKKFGPSGVTPAKTVGGGVSPRQQKVSPETGRAVGETKPSTAPAGSVDEVLAGGKQTPATPAKPAAASQKPAYTFKNKLVQKHIPAEQLKGLSASNRKLLESLTPEEAKKLWGTK